MKLRFLVSLLAISLVCGLGLASPTSAQDSAVGPLLNILDRDLPEERVGTIIEIIGQKGNAYDMGVVYGKLVGDKGYQGKARLAALKALVDAAANRKVHPEGDLAGLAPFISGAIAKDDPAAQSLAIELAGLWKVANLAAPLKSIAVDAKAKDAIRQQALDALVEIGGASADEAIAEMAAEKQPARIRFLALAALAKKNLDKAAALAPAVLAKASPNDDPAVLLNAFLDQQAGVDKLAAALAAAELPQDVAKLALRHIYSIGRTDKSLVDVLTKAAGMEGEVKPLSPEEMKALIAEVDAKGNPERGEAIFRRADLNCFKCHSLNGAGGDIGPDLVDLGGQQPTDYLIESVMLPEKAVKEEFQMSQIIDLAEGRKYLGVIKERGDDRLVIKDAEGKMVTVPFEDPEDLEIQSGGSLMPQGLVRFMTHQELVDLVSYLSKLGKPETKYAKDTSPLLRTWRVLKPVPEELLTAEVPDEEVLVEKALSVEPTVWQTVIANVDGGLPRNVFESGTPAIAYVQADIEVTSPGEVGLQFSSVDGVNAWIDGEVVELEPQTAVELAEGRHQLTLRVDAEKFTNPTLSVRLAPVEGSSAKAETVNRP